MSWLATLLAELHAGRPVQLRGSGPSMVGRIPDGAFIHLAPLAHLGRPLAIDDIVLARVPNGRYYVHLIRAIEGERFLIGNMLGELDGWVERADLHGVVVRIGHDPTFDGQTLHDG
jgi:hypothetical protein